MTNDLLQDYLDDIARQDAYEVLLILKESPFETTEKVAFVGRNGTRRGPFIRKRIHSSIASSNVYKEIFDAQRIGKRFAHLPHIEDYCIMGEETWVVMEYITGENLLDVVYRRNPSVDLAVSVFPQLCDAVNELHTGFARPIIHRDLKPSNVMFSEANLTLIDFGIARVFQENNEKDTKPFGTRAYAPPEQFGFKQTDVRSDIYSLGMLLYFLLTERVPTASLAGSSFKDERIPEALRPVLARATAFDPDARYANTDELRAAFLQAITPCSQFVPLMTIALEIEAQSGSSKDPQEVPKEHPSAPTPKKVCPPTTKNKQGKEVFVGILRTLGCVWDGLLGLMWTIMVIAGIATSINPSPDATMASWTLPVRLLLWLGIMIMAAGIGWMLFYKRPLRRHKLFNKQTFARGLLTGFLIFLVGFILSGIVCAYINAPS